MNQGLMSARIECENPEQAQETFYQKGWTDGLPVVLPTEAKVVAFLASAGLAPGEPPGTIPERNRVFTAQNSGD